MIIKEVFNPQCITYSQMNLIFNARIYYRRLTTWTTAYIHSRYHGIGTSEELFGRLYLEALEIGNMLQIVFGREASEDYSQYLSEFAIAFRDLINAQMEGNTEEINRNLDRLHENVAARAAFLEDLNPYWSEAEYKSLFDAYIQYIIGIANAVAAEDSASEIELFDQLTEHTNRMGDVFAEGLYHYITSSEDGLQEGEQPPQNGEQCITYDEMNAVFGIRMFWFELAIWTRNYMLSRYVGLGDTEDVYARLQQVPAEYAKQLEQIFGAEITGEYIKLIYTYIELIRAFIDAQANADIDEINRITQLLYQNADERAAFSTRANPFWDVEEWRSRLYNNLRSTLDESTTFLIGDYARNIDIFSRILDQAESTSNYFAQGLFSYLNYNQ